MPPAKELPETLQGLAFRNGISIRADPDFHRDMARLIENLEKEIYLDEDAASRPRAWKRKGLIPGFVVITLIGALGAAVKTNWDTVRHLLSPDEAEKQQILNTGPPPARLLPEEPTGGSMETSLLETLRWLQGELNAKQIWYKFKEETVVRKEDGVTGIDRANCQLTYEVTVERAYKLGKPRDTKFTYVIPLRSLDPRGVRLESSSADYDPRVSSLILTTTNAAPSISKKIVASGTPKDDKTHRVESMFSG